MNKIENLVYRVKIWSDSSGQDLIEYALMAGFVAVSAVAGFPPVANSVSQIFSRVASTLSLARGN
jgi:pilus assembly protein Flp/PilA